MFAPISLFSEAGSAKEISLLSFLSYAYLLERISCDVGFQGHSKHIESQTAKIKLLLQVFFSVFYALLAESAVVFSLASAKVSLICVVIDFTVFSPLIVLPQHQRRHPPITLKLLLIVPVVRMRAVKVRITIAQFKFIHGIILSRPDILRSFHTKYYF